MSRPAIHRKDVHHLRLMHRRHRWALVGIAFGALLLTACGGGGGSGNSNSGSSANVTMSLYPTSVSASALTSQPAPSTDFEVNVPNLGPSQVVYIAVQFTESGIASASLVPGGTLPASISVQFRSPASLSPGTYHDTVTVTVCFDQRCTQPLQNSPQKETVTYTVTRSPLALTSVTPALAYAGAQAFTLTAVGASFTQQSAVLWNGTALSTSFSNSTQLTAAVPATDIAAMGTASVTVSDPTFGTSVPQTFTIQASPVTITSLSPSSLNAEGPAFTLTLAGTNFTPQSTVFWNGTPQTTSFVSTTQLTTAIPASLVATPGSATISVIDPLYGQSNSESLTLTVPPLALNSISPATVTVGGPSFTLTALGTSFTPSSSVEWNGVALPTNQYSPTELLAQVPSSDISATGTVSVTVADPNSPPNTTGAQILNIDPPSIDAVTRDMNPQHTGAVTFKSLSFPTAPTWSVNVGGGPSYALIADGEVIVTVDLGSGRGSELLALDQKTGSKVWGPVLISGVTDPAYDNGRVFVVSNPYPNPAPNMQAYDAATGSLDWTTPLNMSSGSAGAPTARNGMVYISGLGALEALDESTGAVVWTNTSPSSVDQEATPAVSADGVYIGSGCVASDLRPATGEVIWNDPADNCSGDFGGDPIVNNQLVYAADEGVNGVVYNAETGAVAGGFTSEPPPAFSSTMGYFLQYSTLSAVTLTNNTLQWTFTGDGNLSGSPIVVNQYVFISSSLGNVYALDAATGAEVWSVNVGSEVDTSYYEMPFSGLAAGDGLLVVPTVNSVTVYTLSTNP